MTTIKKLCRASFPLLLLSIAAGCQDTSGPDSLARLNDEQRAAITRLIEQLQGRVLGLQWQLAEQVQALRETLGRSRVDQDRALDQLNRVLDTEKAIKKAHLEMLLRIKNVLRAEQQAELSRLREADVERKNFELQGEL